MVDLKDINLESFDSVLVFEPMVNEEDIRDLIGHGQADVRATSTSLPKFDKGLYSRYLTYNDPKLYTDWAFGKQIQTSIGNIGPGYGCEVADYGKYVSVKVTYSNAPTGKTASKTFLIVFDPDGSKGNIFQTSNRYRTFSGVSQATSYIKSCASSLKSLTS